MNGDLVASSRYDLSYTTAKISKSCALDTGLAVTFQNWGNANEGVFRVSTTGISKNVQFGFATTDKSSLSMPGCKGNSVALAGYKRDNTNEETFFFEVEGNDARATAGNLKSCAFTATTSSGSRLVDSLGDPYSVAFDGD